jgi:hypothetical protein
VLAGGSHLVVAQNCPEGAVLKNLTFKTWNTQNYGNLVISLLLNNLYSFIPYCLLSAKAVPDQFENKY